MDLWAIMRRVLVQRWPAVPSAPNKIARTASSRSASSATMMALLPPSSRMLRPNRRATVSATRRPASVEPVKLISGRRGSLIIRSPTTRPLPMSRLNTPSSAVVGGDAVGDVLHGDGGQRRG